MIILVITTSIDIGLSMFENLPTKFMHMFFGLRLHLLLMMDFPFLSATSPSFITAVFWTSAELVHYYFAFSFLGENYFQLVMSYIKICFVLMFFVLGYSLLRMRVYTVQPTLSERRPLRRG